MRIRKSVVPTRALFKPDSTGYGGTIYAAQRSGRTFRYGSYRMKGLTPSMPRLAVKTLPTESGAQVEMDKACASRLARGFIEITVNLERRTFYPVTGGLIGLQLQIDLIDTERARQGLATVTPIVGKRERERSALLRDVVAGRATGIALERYDGYVELTTGNVVAADPMLLSGSTALDRPLAPGIYPLVLARVDGRNAAASIVVRDAEPERWELALPRGMRTRMRRDRVEHPPRVGYPVDSGAGCFVDDAVASALDEDERAVRAIFKTLAKDHVARLSRRGAGSVAAFTTGEGDGEYATYYGWRGRSLVCVTTDFGWEA